MLCGALEFLPLDTAKVWCSSWAGVSLRFIVAHLGALVSTTPRVWSISVGITRGVCCRSRGVESRVEGATCIIHIGGVPRSCPCMS